MCINRKNQRSRKMKKTKVGRKKITSLCDRQEWKNIGKEWKTMTGMEYNMKGMEDNKKHKWKTI